MIEVPAEYKTIADKVIQKLGWHTETTAKEYEYNVPAVEANKEILVGLSGGLDSVYLLHKLMDEEYNVTAVHIAGLNKSSAKKEAEEAERIATEAGAHFISIEFKAPKQTFPDNPFKNQLVLSLMLDVGAASGIYRYALGSDWTTPLAEAVTGYTITDSVEVNRCFWDGVKTHFPQAELVFIDDAVKKYERLQYIYTQHRASLEHVSSCIAPLRFRNHWHDQNEKKYGIHLMEGRCGSCYKCAMEYILLVEAGLVEMNQGFYEHCWHTLATSKTAHRPDLFSERLPLKKRLENLKNYGS